MDIIRDALRPFHDPALRSGILDAARSSEQILDEVTPDVLLESGFDKETTENLSFQALRLRAYSLNSPFLLTV